MFSSNVQGQRTLKEKIYGKINGTFRRNRKSDTDLDTLNCPSQIFSDCSTLVELAMSNSQESLSSMSLRSNGDDDDFHPEDQAWSTIPSRSQVEGQIRPNYNSICSITQTSLLDEEECSWNMPRKTHSHHRKHSGLIVFSRKSKVANPIKGLVPELLDPEERSWM